MYSTKQRCDRHIRGCTHASLDLPDLDTSSNEGATFQDSAQTKNLRKMSVSSAGLHSLQ